MFLFFFLVRNLLKDQSDWCPLLILITFLPLLAQVSAYLNISYLMFCAGHCILQLLQKLLQSSPPINAGDIPSF